MLQLREPLRELLKDEVRALGRRLQIHEDGGRGQRVTLDTLRICETNLMDYTD